MIRNGRKGTTLVEMSVVLALVAIISTMVVSFSVLMGQRFTLSNARLNAMNDLTLVENITEAWLGRMALQGAALEVRDQGLYNEICATVVSKDNEGNEDTQTYTLFFDRKAGVLTGTLPGDEVISGATKQVLGVEYGVRTPEDTDYEKFVEKFDGADVYFYTVVYDLPHMSDDAQGVYTQTFFANPHVGDTYGTVNQNNVAIEGDGE